MWRPLRHTAIRPTRDGVAAGLLALLLAGLAAATGNNLLYLLLAPVLGLIGVSVVLGGWNLRGLEVVRVLPAEAFAGVDASGAYLVRNRRRWLASVGVTVEDAEGGAQSSLDLVRPGDELTLPASWRFGSRGVARLGRVRLGSTFPFGLLARTRVIDLTAEILVYPRPSPGIARGEEGGVGEEGPAVRSGDDGDLHGLRPYRPGDRPRAIHWPSSARSAEVLVIVRSGGGHERIVVRVERRRAEAWERELSRACGELLRAFASGAHVGLELPSHRFDALGGDAWRRTLLEALARAPEPS